VNARFERIAVIGLGLLGGSVGLAARSRGLARQVLGSTRSEVARRRALASGAVDALADPEAAVAGAELVVLATPVGAMPQVVRRLAPGLEPGAVLTDVGSVKAPLHETLPGLLPPGTSYVGSHPMAGGHDRGVEHARADLFEGATCVVTGGGQPAAEDRVAAFWRGLGARVVRRSPDQHDREVAWVSHIPHLLAFAFAGALAGAPPGAREVAGPGFRDFTRIAQSDPELWADILQANAKALTAPLAAAQHALGEICRALEAGDAEALEQLLSAARQSLFREASECAPEPTADRDIPAPERGTSAQGDPEQRL
jgi:prephenate dehydrogenase